MKKWAYLLSFGFIALCFQLSANTIYAQQVRLSIDPPIVQTKIKPGKSILVAYTTENTGDPLALQFVIYTFRPVGKTGGVELGDLDGPIEFSLENADISLKTPFFFNTKERKQALIRITIPSTTPEGDYYFMIVAESVPTSPSEGRSTSLTSAQVGAPLLVTVTESGKSEVQARIAEFNVQNTYDVRLFHKNIKLIDSSQRLPVILVIENMGANSIQPEGAITLRKGDKATTYTLLSQNVLKNSQRVIHTSPTTGAPTHISAYVSGFSIGSHSLSAQVSYGSNTPVQFSTVEVFAIPFRILSLVCVTLLLSVGIVYFSKKKKRADKDSY